jgi:Heterokaryon incompatibility protein (HET)
MESFAASFPYGQLIPSKPSIRLMILEPGNFEDPIKCKLEYTDLESNRYYEALSYSWGDPTETTPIGLDDQSFPVTINLNRALHYIRRPYSKRVLWVDAVCINQRDDLERNSQVQLMGRIYKSAAKVYLWVGEEGIQNPIYPSVIPMQQLFRLMRHINKGSTLEAELKALNISIADWSYSILDFIGREYFRRLWIVQEASVNAETELVCGKVSMSWAKVQLSLESIYKFMKDMDMTDFTSESLQCHFHHVLCLGETWFNWGAFSKLQVSRTADTRDPKILAERIFKVLQRLDGRFKSSDPKDRLFAILSMVSSSQGALSELGLNVDYRKSASQIFHELVIFLLKHRKNLDILTHCTPDSKHLYGIGVIPSWVPTWGPNPSGTLREIASNEKPLSDISCRFSKDERTLFLRGAIFDRVAFVADEISFSLDTHIQGATQTTDDVLILRAKLKSLEDQILDHPLLQRGYRNDRDAKEILKHTLLHPNDKEQMLAEHAYYDTLTDQGTTFSTTKDSNLSHIMSASRGSRSSRWKPHELKNKRAFITSRGHIGVAEGPALLKVDDLICLFRGGTVPFILRTHGRSYELVSTCYVYDIMDVRKQYKLVRRWKCLKFPIR